MMGGGMMGGFGSFGLIGWILNLVITLGVIVGIVLLVVWLVRQFANGSPNVNSAGSQQANPLDIAQSRYARGDITRDEYQQIQSDLSA
ncbi:MAG: SHOCT domain-containing protein [Chloroflexi bacterium]|nr:MAG: SHOCT domain-containing protein [Chloroflexota bacterium]MBL1197459.1 SHOCT domain-containing protein [Chloroflexota bacterium]NOH14754.1 SHOCT domain-containing protein [Chloroflexota bacterium]